MTSRDLSAELFRGAESVEPTQRGVRPHRLPAWVREQFPDPQLLSAQSQPSGVRLSFQTRSTRIELRTQPARVGFVGLERPRGAIDVVIDGDLVLRDRLTGGDFTIVDMGTGDVQVEQGAAHATVVTGLPETTKRVEIWLPHSESVEVLSLATDADITPVASEGSAPWVHYGSSISQGSNATGPSATWPAVAAQSLGVEMRNLGFSGSAMLDPFAARVLRDTPADLISVKLGINVVNLDGMRLRTFVPAVHGFLDTIRDGHPTTPIVLVSPVHCGIHENTPGPGAFDPEAAAAGEIRFVATGTEGDTDLGRLTLEVIRDALRQVAQTRATDPNLHYVDGLTLYGAEDEETLPLPDGLHPDTDAHRLIGERFADRVRPLV